ncbi:hypothetical protein HYALB_00007042 [Hymenoscyphus albidus]|uniref:Uncharacterized protein n=1 Tax=Hymenoscyphus albidus TaxID=595503 RepID=A0A9N9LQA6_9HELO|nr:hypothetical protein HYALB_00007042 [Hymenoscyphus albidus]
MGHIEKPHYDFLPVQPFFTSHEIDRDLDATCPSNPYRNKTIDILITTYKRVSRTTPKKTMALSPEAYISLTIGIAGLVLTVLGIRGRYSGFSLNIGLKSTNTRRARVSFLPIGYGPGWNVVLMPPPKAYLPRSKMED